MPAITALQFEQLMERELPFAKTMGLAVDEVGEEEVKVRAVYNSEFLRPGGTVSGPVMMGLADAAMYLAVMARLGPVALAVTTQLSINFLRKPEPGDVIAVARLLKLGKRLAVGEVALYSASHPEDEMVAHVTATYSIPPQSSNRSA
ncbi:MAG: PaaI family thioesterase [Granulosicoccaceae bacterium]